MNVAHILDLMQLLPVQRALLALIIASVTMPVAGVFIIGLNIQPVRFAMMHVALLGIALGLILKVEPMLIALGLCAASGAVVAPLADRPAGLSSPMGFLMPLAVAAALFMLSISGVNANGAFELLWGSILATRVLDVIILAAIGAIVIGLYVAQRRNLALLLYDREIALCSGVDIQRLTLSLLVVIAVAIAASVKFTGALLVDAITLLPALGARNLGTSLGSMVRWSIVLALVGNGLGFALTLALNQPPGPMLVLTVGGLSLLTYFKTH